MSLVRGFKTFAMRGNVMNLAIAVLLGMAFGKVVHSRANDFRMPPLGKLLGGSSASFMSILAKSPARLWRRRRRAGAPLVKYSAFISAP